MYFLCSTYFCVILCIVCFVTFPVLFVCICVLYYCQRVATQLQLNISYRIITLRYRLSSGIYLPVTNITRRGHTHSSNTTIGYVTHAYTFTHNFHSCTVHFILQSLLFIQMMHNQITLKMLKFTFFLHYRCCYMFRFFTTIFRELLYVLC
jgi:hypothetical protein